MDIKDELLFWTSIMRDHANFQVNALAPKEQTFIENSTYFMDFFAKINLEIKDSDSLKMIYPKLLHGLQCFIGYKRVILKNLLTCNIAINLTPSNISHQINEANLFMMVLSAPDHKNNQIPTMLYVEQLKLWITDCAGHGAIMAAFLEPAEEMYIQQALNYKMIFEKLTIKASELQMMLMQTGLEDGILLQLSQEAKQQISDFTCFCELIMKLREECKVMAIGTFTPLVPNHFIREQRHWISKIEEYK
ncbi:MAG: hypothetical protein K0S75_773 [Clostridia bacterium]|jgi:hypothetical protein|nr:hypothetical protein [Clostridia bacterium]